jgi:hypothetical protein
MRFSLVPRQACQRGRRVLAIATPASTQAEQGPSAKDGARDGHSPQPGSASAQAGQALTDRPHEQNHVVLTGVLAADPREVRGQNGKPVVVLLLAFQAPEPLDPQAPWVSAWREINVPQALARKYPGKMHAGDPLLIAGRLAGKDLIAATHLCTGPPFPKSRDPDQGGLSPEPRP